MNKPLSLPWLTTRRSSLTTKRLSQHSSLPFLLTFCLLLALLPLTTVAQTVTGSTPARNANATAVSTNISVIASDAFAGDASNAIKVFSRQAGGKKAGTATVSGNTLTFDPAANFKPGETVFTTLTTASGLAKAHVYQFTTAAAPAPGSFSGTTDVAVGVGPRSVATADVDREGDLDILSANVSSNNVSVRLNDGKGAFSGATNLTVGARPYSIAAADVDGDGDLDILSANAGSNSVSVLLNNGSGAFSGATDVTVGILSWCVAAADVDGDGDLDILTANAGSNSVSVRFNDGKGIFTGTADVAVGDFPLSVAAADVDGDGDLDILTANEFSNSVSVRLNDGKGTFSGTMDLVVGDGPEGVAAADMDGDGDLDILAANTYSHTVSVRLNDGAGAFSNAADVAVGDFPISVIAADVNGDGDLDILTANVYSHTVNVRLNDGKGGFSGTTEIAVGSSPYSVTAADVDGDGDLDILTANAGNNFDNDDVSVRLNGALVITLHTINKATEKEDVAVSFTATEFSDAFSSNGGSLSKVKITSLPDAATGILRVNGVNVTLNQEITVADLGNLTFVPAANYNGSASFKWNGSDGSVYAASDATVNITLAAVNDAPSFTKGADQVVNEDAGAQLVAGWATAISKGPANESSQTIDFIVSNNNPALFSVQPAVLDDGTLTYTPAKHAFGSATVSVHIKDNGGTDLGGVDVSALQTFTITVQGTRTVTGLTPQRNAVAAPVATHITATASAPFLNTASTTSSIHVFSRQAGGKKAGTATVSGNTLTFDPAADFKPGETVFTTLTPASGLAKPHVYQFTTATARASGTFSGSTDVAVVDNPYNNHPSSVAAADMDGDGDLDMVVAKPTSEYVNIRFNDGSGSFSGTTNLALLGGYPISVAAADVDGDRDLDILTANYSSGKVAVLLNDGLGSFSRTADVAVGSSPTSVAVADVDGDGDLDILAAHEVTAGTVSVRLNDGRGTFSGSINVAVGANPNSVAAADVDGDGDLDILTANLNSDNVSVRLNDGAGSFSTATDVAVGAKPASVAAADVDGDGDLDFLTSNYGNNTVSVRLNDGSGTFTGTTDVAVGSNPASVAAADVDGDGDVDILAANANGGSVSVRLNGSFITLSDINKATEKEDVAVSFTAADFSDAFSSNGGSLSKVKITSLPDAATGTLRVSGVDVTLNQEILVDDLASLTLIPTENYNGPVSFSWNGSDGSAYSASDATVNITLAPVNDAPTFSIAHDPATVNEDAGAQTVPNFATSLTDGDPEVDQPLNFTITGNNNEALFSVAPAIANDGTLIYTPAANANGTALIKVTLSDNGSALDPDANTSEEKTFTITVNAVNDAPGFTKGADQRVSEDAGPQIVGNWATSLSKGPANESAQTIDFIVTNTNNSLFSTQPAVLDDGTLTYTPAADAFGSATVSVKITDNGGTANGGVNESAIQTFTITITAVNDAPVVLATPSTQQVQYSDQIASVRIAATDVDNSLNQLNATSSWKLTSAVSFSSGLPGDLALTKIAEGSWSLSGKMMVAPGTYIVRVTVSDGTADVSNNFGYADIEIVVAPEDARVTYTGALFASTSGATSGKATVTLSATIQDITALTGDPAYDIFAGDIKKASLTFKIVETGQLLLAPIGYVNSSDKKTGTATTTWNIDIGSSDSKQYTVQLIIGDHYVGPLTPAYEVVTVSKPLNDFVTGGGFIILSNSAGQKAGNAGSKNNFGFNIKYNKKGTSLQGNINTLIRRTEADGVVHVYQIKGNAMTSLSVKASTTTTRQAVFNGKASIQDITNPLAPLSVDGNATLQVNMTDMGEPGTSDKIGITVWNKDGGLWFSSTWDGAKTIEKTLAGGNLIIRGASTARMDFENFMETEPSAQVKAYPNPVLDKVTIDLGGLPATGVKTLLTDAVGKPVLENGHKVVGESLLEIDMSGLKSAMYIIQLRSERAYKIVKVIKQ